MGASRRRTPGSSPPTSGGKSSPERGVPAPFDAGALLERISDGFLAIDRDWRFVYVNERAGELVGRRPAELVGKKVWDEFPEALGQPAHHAVTQAMAEQRSIVSEDYFAPWQRWFEVRAHPSAAGSGSWPAPRCCATRRAGRNACSVAAST